MTLQLEYANTLGAFPASIIQLAKTSHMYHDPVRNQMIIEQLYQAWLVQMTNPFPLAMSYLPNGQEVQIGNSHMTRFYLGTTNVADIDILDPRTGAGSLLQAVRAIPKITPMPGQSRSAFMIAVMHALNIQGELTLNAIGAMNEMYRRADLNDLRGVVDYGQSMEYTFPDYRIPCLVHYQGPSTHRMITGTAFSVLDPGDRSQPGRVRAMEALPDPRHFLDFLDRFLKDPWWDGISN